MQFLIYLGICVGAYLIGSISPALIISHTIAKRDIRKEGSGNAGATNMIRTYGWGFGLMTFALDVFKGALATYVGGWIAGDVGMSLAALWVVVGHNLPIYYGFKGGKGISATLGVFLVIRPIPTLVMLGIVLILLAIFRVMSITSISGVLLEAISAFVLQDVSLPLQLTVLALAIIAIIGHLPNIKRLMKGTEPRLVGGKPPKKGQGVPKEDTAEAKVEV